jgi:hypothetical protein
MPNYAPNNPEAWPQAGSVSYGSNPEQPTGPVVETAEERIARSREYFDGLSRAEVAALMGKNVVGLRIAEQQVGLETQ